MDDLRPDPILLFDRTSQATVCVWDTALALGYPGGVRRESPDRPISDVVLEGRRYRVAAHIEGPSGHTESDIVEVVGVGGRQSLPLDMNRPAPALDSNDVCRDFYSRTEPSSTRRSSRSISSLMNLRANSASNHRHGLSI
jgi:hypothetical protein